MSFHAEDATGAARNIQAMDRNPDGGAIKAYELFRQDYNNYAAHHSASDTAAFLKTATSDLVSNKVLPDVAVGWGADNRTNLDPNGNPTRWDLTHLPGSADPLDKVLAQSLSQEFPKVAGVGSGDSNAIHDSDWNAFTSQQHLTNFADTGVKTLMQSQNGKKDGTLFDFIDSLPGGKQDGKIDQDDFQRYMGQYQFDKQHNRLSPQETQQNYDFVKYLNDHWNDPEVLQLRSQPGSPSDPIAGPITYDSLAKAGQFSSVDQMLSSEKTPAQKPQSPETTSSPSPETNGAPGTRELETTIADVLAKQPELGKVITDGAGHIDKTKVMQLLDSMRPDINLVNGNRTFMDPYNMLTRVTANWNDLAKQFSTDGGKTLDLNKITSYGFGNQTFDDRLSRDGNEPISGQDRTALTAFYRSNPGFLADASGVITKASVDDAYTNRQVLPAEFQKFITQLHDSYYYLASDNGTINIHNFQ